MTWDRFYPGPNGEPARNPSRRYVRADLEGAVDGEVLTVQPLNGMASGAGQSGRAFGWSMGSVTGACPSTFTIVDVAGSSSAAVPWVALEFT